MEAPKGLIPFNKLDLCQPYHNQLKIITALSVGISIIGVTISIIGGFNWLIIPVCITSILIFLVFGLDTWALINTPLGVNMNHPFVDDEPIGKALVYVRFSIMNGINGAA